MLFESRVVSRVASSLPLDFAGELFRLVAFCFCGRFVFVLDASVPVCSLEVATQRVFA